ncbi:MAG TPA: MOSC N-terminal beta barrel domain-containing protein [Pseudonocardia sp.]|nr:MOSC N-terminal beta barrel domain-containing protein [Pseudonocardia sp.]
MLVTALYRCPVKSMLGEPLERCRVDERGVVGDRCYALVDVETSAGARRSTSRSRRCAAS